MWCLQSFDDHLIYLWEKNKYYIGRKNKDITLDDESVSRNHAEVELKNNEIYITDTNSKYGTFIGSTRLKTNVSQKLSNEEVVVFGILKKDSSIFKVQKVQFKVALSNINSNDKLVLLNDLTFLKAVTLSTWDKNCTHIIASEIKLTPKILCALTTGQHIVNPKYFSDYVNAVKNNQPAPKLENYVPELNEALLDKNIKLEFSPNRAKLFKDITFVFLTEKRQNTMKDLITCTGGKVNSWEKKMLDLKELKQSSSNYLLIEENVDEEDKKSTIYKSFQEAVRCLLKIGKRPIPLQEIALAIIHNSCEENCNPLFNKAALLLRKNTEESHHEDIIVLDTEQTSQNQKEVSADIPTVVDASFTEKTISATISQSITSFKRPLEDEPTQEINKRLKEEKVVNTSETSFNFRNFTKTSTPTNFKNEDTNKESINEKEKLDLVKNPFSRVSRKRKALNELPVAIKKTFLENITNTPITNTPSSHISKTQDKSKNITVVDTSSLLNGQSWINKSTLKNLVHVTEPEDEEVIKINEMFKNCIKIQFNNIDYKKKSIEQNLCNSNNQNNFKKFKKILPKIQSEIISTNPAVIKSGSILQDDDDDDDNDNDEVDDDFDAVKIQPTKRRFQFRY